MVVFHAMLMRWKLLRQHQSPPTVLEEKKTGWIKRFWLLSAMKRLWTFAALSFIFCGSRRRRNVFRPPTRPSRAWTITYWSLAREYLSFSLLSPSLAFNSKWDGPASQFKPSRVVGRGTYQSAAALPAGRTRALLRSRIYRVLNTIIFFFLSVSLIVCVSCVCVCGWVRHWVVVANGFAQMCERCAPARPAAVSHLSNSRPVCISALESESSSSPHSLLVVFYIEYIGWWILSNKGVLKKKILLGLLGATTEGGPLSWGGAI